MNQNGWMNVIMVACIAAITSPLLLMAEQQQYSESDYYFYEPGPVRQSRLYIDGSIVELETGSLTCPVVGSDLSNITPAEFFETARQVHMELENAPNKLVVSPERSRQGGLNIVFNCTSVPPAALPALESVAVYLEHLFADTATITINMSFASLGPGILGMAQRFYAGNPSYTVTRNSLLADMDADDSIQTWLPTGSTFPVRYFYSSPTVTNEDRVYFVVAVYNAVIGNYPGLASNITYSTNVTWDYDPSDGVAGFCFQSVVAHEIGHVLGFTSKASEYGDCDVLDLYRFQRSDGAGNYNPDTWSEFQTTARMVDASTGLDDVNSDLIEAEYQMSDGDPYQCSHFSQGNVYAIMQPAFSGSQTYYPNFYQVPDRNMFDAIGWDYVLMYYLTTNIAGEGSVIRNPDSTWYTPGTTVELTAIPDSGWMFYQWGGGLIGDNNPDTVIMDGDITVTASFLTEYVTLTLNINGNGTVNITPNLP
ncbi:MAG: NF038122 family metalloprotease, partial [bacterium]